MARRTLPPLSVRNAFKGGGGCLVFIVGGISSVVATGVYFL